MTPPVNAADKNDLPPRGEEAKAQATQTVMPWVFGLIGFVVVAIFVAFLMMQDSRTFGPARQVIAPAEAPANR